MMKDAVLSFAEQFAFVPRIEYPKDLSSYKQVVILGMGGSHLAGDILSSYCSERSIIIHSDYELPSLPVSVLKQSLIIASSYSGNTEEVLDGVSLALENKLSVAVISVGGELLDIAQRHKLPHVVLPNTGIQPRSALGLSLIALFTLLHDTQGLREARLLQTLLEPKKIEPFGKKLAMELQDRVPVIYTSTRNTAVAYNWKIKFNETGKIPAFYNVIPELNHNEMTGFDVAERSVHLSQSFSFLFLVDSDDHPKNQLRMDTVQQLYTKRGLKTKKIEMMGTTRLEKIFCSLLLADFAAVYVAEYYGLESELVPMVEEFKKIIVQK